MEFAVSALLLLVLLIPGFIFQLAYSKALFRGRTAPNTRSITEQIPSSTIFAGIFHLIWMPLASNFGTIKYDVLLMFLLGNFGHENDKMSYAFETIAAHPYKPAIYFFSLCAFAGLCGLTARQIIRSCHLDHKYKTLRFANEWFYWFTGEINQFEETEDVDGEIVGTILSAVVHHNTEDYLYLGLVIDYFFDKDGNLDRILIEQASRRKLCDDKSEDNDNCRFYPIDSHYMVLKYSEINTISLRYLTITNKTGSNKIKKRFFFFS